MDITSSGDLLQKNKNLKLPQRHRGTEKKIKTFLHLYFIAFFLFTFGELATYAADSPPKITVTPMQVNLGVMKKDEVKLYKVTVGNRGKGNLYITNIPAPNEKTGIPLAKNAIKPGKKIELTLFYKGIDTGKIKDYVFIESNDPKTPSVKIILKGEVR